MNPRVVRCYAYTQGARILSISLCDGTHKPREKQARYIAAASGSHGVGVTRHYAILASVRD